MAGNPGAISTCPCAANLFPSSAKEEGDPWINANARCIGEILSVIRGDLGRDAGLAHGLFDLAKALPIDQRVTQAFG